MNKHEHISTAISEFSPLEIPSLTGLYHMVNSQHFAFFTPLKQFFLNHLNVNLIFLGFGPSEAKF